MDFFESDDPFKTLWESIAGTLSSPEKGERKKSQKRCHCRIVDTVFFRYDGWGEGAPLQALNQAEFGETLASARGDEGLEDVAMMQCYLRPQGGRNEVYRWDYANGQSKAEIVTRGGERWGEGEELHSKPLAHGHPLEEEMQTLVQEVTRILELATESKESSSTDELAQSRKVVQLRAEFVLDDNSQLWLSKITDLKLGDPGILDIPSAEDFVTEEGTTKAFQKMAKSPRQSLPELTKRKAPLFQRQGDAGVYVARVGFRDLPGLASWFGGPVDGELDADMETPRWELDWDKFQLLKKKIWEENGEPEDSDFVLRSNQRYSMTQKSVLLALETADFLAGKESTSDGPAAYVRRWARADNQAKLRLAKKSPQEFYSTVQVCGNTREVCQFLDRLRSAGFGLAREESLEMLRPSSEPASSKLNQSGRLGSSSRDRRGSDQHRNTRSAGKLVGETEHSPIPSDGPDAAAGGADTTPRSSRGSGQVGNTAPTIEEELSKSVKLKKDTETRERERAKELRKEQERKDRDLNRLYGTAPEGSKRAKKKRGKTRGKDKAKDLSKTEGFDLTAPPSMDMMAKFEAKRERERQRLDQEEKEKPSVPVTSKQRGVKVKIKGAGKEDDVKVAKANLGLRKRASKKEKEKSKDQEMSVPDAPFQPQSISLAEEQFMQRRGGGGGQRSPNSVSETVVAGANQNLEVLDALRSRLSDMEQECGKLRRKLAESEESEHQALQRMREAQKKLARSQTEFSRTLKEKVEDHKTEILEMEEQHHAALVAAVEEAKKVSGTGNILNTDLIKKLEDLHVQFSDAQAKWLTEKREMMSSHASDLQAVGQKYRAELAEARADLAAMEDKNGTILNQLADLQKTVNMQQEREKEADRRVKTVLLEKDQLETQNAALKQTLRATQSLDLMQGDTIRDGQATIAALTANSEARIRQLNNKVEYLKSQLASECSLKDELQVSINAMKKKLEEAQMTTRQKLQDAEVDKETAITDIEARHKSQMESQISELSHLQAKVATLQDQLTDALQETSMAKRKEDNSKNEAARLMTQVSTLQGVLKSTQDQLNEYSEIKLRSDEVQAELATNEAMLRRLDNERQYLKSQLTSEITCRNELQAALDNATQELGEAKTSWQREVSEKEYEFRQEALRRDGIESQLRQDKAGLESENTSLTKQLEALKEAYTKIRDQLRLDQVTLENVRAGNQRLKDELEAGHEEIKALKRQVAEGQDRHSSNMNSVQISFEDMERKKDQHIEKLQAEVRKSLEKVTETQRQMIELRDQMHESGQEHQKNVGADRLSQILKAWMHRRTYNAFMFWVRSHTIGVGDELMATRIEMTKQQTEARAAAEREEACQMVMDNMRKQREEALGEAWGQFEADRARMLQDHEEKLRVSLEEAQAAHAEALSLRESEFKAEEQRMNELHQQQLQQKDEFRAKREEDVRAEETKIREKALKDAANAAFIEKNNALEEKDDQWRKLMKEKISDMKADKEQALARASEEYHQRTKALHAEFDQERKDIRYEESELKKKAVQEENERMSTEMAKKEQQWKEDLMQAVEDERQRGKEREEQMEEKHKEDVEQKCNQTREECRLQWEAERKDLIAKHKEAQENAVTDATLKIQGERSKYVRLEVSKWEKALQDAEGRVVAERRAAWVRGMQERDVLAKKEAEQLKAAAEKALQEVKNSAKATLEAARQEAERSLEATKQEIEKQKDEEAQQLLQNERTIAEGRQEEALEKLRKELEKEKADSVDACWQREQLKQEKLREEMVTMKQKWDEDRVELQEWQNNFGHLEEKRKADVRRAEREGEEKLENAKMMWEADTRKQLFERTNLLEEKRKEQMEQQIKRAEEQRQIAIRETEERVMKEMDDTMINYKEETKLLVQNLEDKIEEMKKNRLGLVNQLNDTEKRLESAEDANYDLETMNRKLKSEHSISLWRTAINLSQLKEKKQSELEEIKTDLQGKVADLRAETEEMRADLQLQIDDLTAVLEEADNARSDMHEVLVNHKRDVLVEQKVKSAAVQRELEQLMDDRLVFVRQKEVVNKEIAEYEAQAKDLEHQLHVLSKTSAFQDGRVNVAHAKKKKRINAEYEEVLDHIENKNNQIRTIDAKIQQLVDAHHNKEDEMKNLERILVQVLVEQQRKLLILITSAKNASKSLEARREKRAEEQARQEEKEKKLRDAGLIK